MGRNEELAALDEFLAGPPVSRVLILEGDPGAGKSTLWDYATERAAASGYHVRSIRPAEAERQLSYTGLADLVSGLLPDVERLPQPQRRALRTALLVDDSAHGALDARAVAVGLLGLLRVLSRRQALLVAIDDAQWLDSASAAALSFALRRAAEDKVAVVVARRRGEDDRLELSLRQVQLDVGGLSFGAVQRMVRDRVPLLLSRSTVRRIHERSGGNPFFALELARALATRGRDLEPGEELPLSGRLDALVGARIAALPKDSLAALARVAALGEPRVEVAGDDAPLEPAFDAGVVTVVDDRVRFTHPLLSAAAYGALTPFRRRRMHQMLAASATDVEQRAHHLALASDAPDENVARELVAAGESAHARGAIAAAAEYGELALRFGRADAATAAKRAAVAAEYVLLTGDHRHARELLVAALRSAPPGPPTARLELGLASCTEVVDDMLGHLHASLSAVDGDPALEARILGRLAMALANERSLPESLPFAERALVAAERAGNSTVVARALTALAVTRFWLGQGFPHELAERALALDRHCESLPLSDRPVTLFGWMYKWAGDLERSRELLEQSIAIGERRGDSTLDSPIYYRAHLHVLADEWQLAAADAERLHEFGIDFDRANIRECAVATLAVIAAHTGDEPAAREAAAQASRYAAAAGARGEDLIGFAVALLELSLGRHQEALERARSATAAAHALGVEEPALLWVFPTHAEAAIAMGELDEARALLDWVDERAVRVDREWALACSARCRGLLAAATGDERAASEMFERALAQHRRVEGRRFELARTRLAQGVTLRRFKRRSESRAAIEEAASLFDELGAFLWGARARSEMARVSGRRHEPGLTTTERRVAELVASGKSNKEVAGELFVSVRAVEANLTKIYAKLGVRSRTELAARLHR